MYTDCHVLVFINQQILTLENSYNDADCINLTEQNSAFNVRMTLFTEHDAIIQRIRMVQIDIVLSLSAVHP